MLMFFMETVGFYYRVKWIKYILLRNRKIKINCFWLVTLCPEGAVLVLVVVLAAVLAVLVVVWCCVVVVLASLCESLTA